MATLRCSGAQARRQRWSRRGLHDANEDVAGVAAAFQHALSAPPLPASITAVMDKPRYTDAKWSLLVTDVATGESWYGLKPDQMSLTGSTRKLILLRKSSSNSSTATRNAWHGSSANCLRIRSWAARH